MATKLTANGVSTTSTPGTEQYEVFYTGYRTRRKKHYQYDFRHTDGVILLRCRHSQRVQTTP